MLNGSDEVIEEKNDSNTSGSKENPEDVDSCELEDGTEGDLVSTVSFSTKDGVVQSPKPGSKGALTFEHVLSKDGVIPGGDGSGDVVLEGAPPSTNPIENVGSSDVA